MYKILLIFLFILAACQDCPPQQNNTLTAFDYQNNTFDIFGVTEKEGEEDRWVIHNIKTNKDYVYTVVFKTDTVVLYPIRDYFKKQGETK